MREASSLHCLPRVSPKVHVSPALRQQFPLVEWGDADGGFQNSHVLLVPHLVSLTTCNGVLGSSFSPSHCPHLGLLLEATVVPLAAPCIPSQIRPTQGAKGWEATPAIQKVKSFSDLFAVPVLREDEEPRLKR